MEIYKSFNEMAEGTGALDAGGGNGMSFVDNMSTIDRFGGYDIQLPSDDHEPPHVQIRKGDEKMGKLPIHSKDAGSLTYDVSRIPRGDLKKLKKHIAENRDLYMKKWREIRGGGADT